MDVYKTTNFGNNKIVILSNIENENFVSSISELNGHSVLAVNNTAIAKILNNNKVDFKGFNNINALLNNIKEDSVIIVDNETYNYYK